MFHPYSKLAHYRHTPNSSSFATRTCLPLRKENEWLYFLSLFYSSSMCFDSVSNLKWSKRLHLICLRCIRKRCSGSEKWPTITALRRCSSRMTRLLWRLRWQRVTSQWSGYRCMPANGTTYPNEPGTRLRKKTIVLFSDITPLCCYVPVCEWQLNLISRLKWIMVGFMSWLIDWG